MGRFKDLTFSTFGKLFVICPTESKRGDWYWWCHCECGGFIETQGARLTNGTSKSCGCVRKEKLADIGRRSKIHGDRFNKNSPYGTWVAIHNRCNRPNVHNYSSYGGRGIRVCHDWDNYIEFKYWAILHGWHKGLTIDRLDSDRNYCPENCEWVTPGENTRRRNIANKLRRS